MNLHNKYYLKKICNSNPCNISILNQLTNKKEYLRANKITYIECIFLNTSSLSDEWDVMFHYSEEPSSECALTGVLIAALNFKYVPLSELP